MLQEELDFLKERYFIKYPNDSLTDFDKYWVEYRDIEDFAPHGNINDNQKISEQAHYIMRLTTQYHLTQAFKAMKIDLQDPNVTEVIEEGNIGTPGRIAKVWCGSNTDDDTELGGGRWSKSPRIASFPSTPVMGISRGIPITKRIDLVSNCSHHFIPFHTKSRQDSYAIISYIPKNGVRIGISKLQRVADFVSQRFWLQEDLTDTLYTEISKVADTDDVYIGLYNLVHGCENLRGAKSQDGTFSSEAYGGAFGSPTLRDQVKGQ